MDKLLENSIEYDLNPFIIFNSDAKVVKYNEEAEILLSYISSKEIFDIAMSYAPINYGYKNSYISLEFNRVKYYAILVGYEDEKYIVVKLYKEVSYNSFNLEQNDVSKVCIYTLLELACNNTLTKTKLIKNYDPSIPEVYLNVKAFLKLLNLSLKEFQASKKLTITVSVKVAENILINGKRYPVCLLSFFDKDTLVKNDIQLEKQAKEANLTLFLEKDKISFEFALMDYLGF
jgi:hypothetical protein